MRMALGWCVDQYGNDTHFQRDLDRAATMSPGDSIRLDVVDEYVTRADGTRDWSATDHKIGSVARRGLTPHLMIPYWMRGYDKLQSSDPTVIAKHVQFAKETGQRYGPVVKSAEDGNEGNRQGDFAPDGAKPELQANISLQVCAVLPSTWTLVSPGMAPAPTSGGSLTPTDYLARYWPIAGRVHQGCGIHPYGRSADAGYSWSVLGQMPGIYKLTKVPFWCTEYNGWKLPDATNAQWVAETLPWLADLRGGGLLQRRRIVQSAFIFAMSDPSTETSTSGHLGCIDANGNDRPVLATIANWIATR